LTDYIDNAGATQTTNVTILFLSNDTDCPVVNYALKPSTWTESDFFNSTDYTGDDNVDLTDDELVISTITQQETEFLLVAETLSGVLAPKNVEVRILPACTVADQTITLVDSAALEMVHDKSQGVITIVNETILDSLFDVSNADSCLIDNYQVVHAGNSSAIADTDEAYGLFDIANIDGLNILLNTDLAA